MLRLSEKLNTLNAKKESNNFDESLNIATSIKNFLQKLLNTRQGSVLSAPAMGMPSININEGIIGLQEQQSVLNIIHTLLKKYDQRIETLTSELTKNKNVTVILSFQLSVVTRSEHAINILGKLQSDSTFALELQ
jgi:predicted component of type VI protein secretion system